MVTVMMCPSKSAAQLWYNTNNIIFYNIEYKATQSADCVASFIRNAIDKI